MKKILLFALLFQSVALLSQTKPSFVCSFFGTDVGSNVKNGTINSFASNTQAIQAVDRILFPTGLKRNFIIEESIEVANACAVNIGDKRYILYNKEFMKMVDNSTKTDWASISILAHEIGHHLNGHTLDNTGSRPNKELEADDFSGFVLYKLGASLQDAQKAISTLVSEEGSSTHPGKFARLTAIQKGWSRAASVNSTNTQPPPPVSTQVPMSNTTKLENNVEFKTNVKITLNKLFHRWDDRWSVDSYVDASNTISSIVNENGSYKVIGTFDVIRSLIFMKQRITVNYTSIISADSTTSFSVKSLCYQDASSGMQDCF